MRFNPELLHYFLLTTTLFKLFCLNDILVHKRKRQALSVGLF